MTKSHSGVEGDPNKLRGLVSRAMLAEDARWAMDVALSAGSDARVGPYFPLIMGHHFVRIAYEGAIAVRSSNPQVGVPSLASLLEPEYDTITARARHLTKLLDNTQKSYADVLADLASEIQTHHQAFTGNARHGAKWLETDLGLFVLEGWLIGGTIPIAYRFGFRPAPMASVLDADIRSVSEEWGRTFRVLGAVTFDPSAPSSSLNFSDVHIRQRDRLTSKYLRDRFDSQFAIELKVLLLLVEGDLNTSRLLLPQTKEGHEGPVFRAQVVTLYHCLSALKHINQAQKANDTPGLRRLRSLLADQRTRRLLSRGGSKVRNRSVHYEINDPTIMPDIQRPPMYGLVESVYPERTFEEFEADMADVAGLAAEFLAGWKP